MLLTQLLNNIWVYWCANWQLYVGLGLMIDSGLLDAGYHPPAWLAVVLTAIAGLHTANYGGQAIKAMLIRQKQADRMA